MGLMGLTNVKGEYRRIPYSPTHLGMPALAVRV